MFVHGRQWYWKHDNQRIVDNNRSIYTDILAHESLKALCEGADIEYDDADWIATGLVLSASSFSLIGKKLALARLFDRSWLHRNSLLTQCYGHVPSHVISNPKAVTSETWVRNNPKSWCQTCGTNSVEDRTHWLATCPSLEATDIRKKWLEQLNRYVSTKLPGLYSHLTRQLKLLPNGTITYQGSASRASLLMAGYIPKQWWRILYNRESQWMNTPPNIHDREKLDLLDDKYYKFLKWHSKQFLNRLWRPMTQLRQKHYVKRGPDLELTLDTTALNTEPDNEPST